MYPNGGVCQARGYRLSYLFIRIFSLNSGVEFEGRFAVGNRYDIRIRLGMVTALNKLQDKIKGMNASADDFISKPYKIGIAGSGQIAA